MEKNNNKPKLRFPGFTDPWEQRKLSDKVDIIGTGKSKFTSNIQKTERKPYAVLGSTSVISYDDEYDYSGEFVLTARVGANAGDLYRYSGNVKISDNTVFLKGKNLDFIFFTLTKFNLKNLAFGTGQPLIKASELSNLNLMLPSQVEEQKQIGDFFNNLDNLITLHQQKLNHLQDKKKSLLQKMFPKNGEDFPELRFPGFTDPWEQRKLGLISDKVTEKNTENFYDETLTNSAEFGIVTQRDFFDKDISNAKNLNGYYVVHNDDFVYNPRISNFAPVGPIKRNRLARTGVMSPLYYVFRTHDIDITYLEHYFDTTCWHSFMKLNGDSGARADRFAIKDSVFIEMPIPFPRLEEQKKIAKFFDTLTILITLHQRKLNHLKEQKKALLQQMFV